MSDFMHILTFIRRQKKAEIAGNGYPHDRVINSERYQAQLAQNVQLCVDGYVAAVDHRNEAIELGLYWKNKSERLQAELDAKQVEATLTYGKAE
jgi:hypothetical protein